MENNLTLLEKYFPKTFDDLLLPSKVKSELTKSLENVNFRLLLHSSPGTGKTTTSRILTSTGDFEVMYISGSNDFKIDTIRSKIYPFSTGASISNKRKLIIIDEAENIRDNLQDAFKIVFDRMKSVSFIFITNKINEMNDAIVSRCSTINYDFTGDNLKEQQANFAKFLKRVITEEQLSFDPEGLKKIFNTIYPDFRQLLILLQRFKDTNTSITLEAVLDMNKVGRSNDFLYKLLETPAIQGKELYESLSELKGREKDCFLSLGEPFFEHLNGKGLYDKTLQTAVIVAKYANMFLNTSNKFTTLLACVVELKTLFR